MDLPVEYDIRFTEESDLSALLSFFASPKDSEGFPFDETEKEQALKNWIGFSRYRASLTGMWEGSPCAVGTLFLMPYRKVAHHCSFYLVVASEHRRKGIGSSMVRNLLHLAKTRFKLESVHVEILGPNPLLSIVKKEGFRLFAEQQNFVSIGEARRPRFLLEHFFV